MSESEAPLTTPIMSANNLGYGPMKAFPLRLNDSTRTQLDIIAKLNDRTVTDEGRLAIEAWIEKAKSDPAVQQRAESVRAEIEREAATKRDAIAAIFDASPPTAQKTAARGRQTAT